MEACFEKDMKVYASSGNSHVPQVGKARQVSTANADLMISIVIYQQNPAEFRKTIISLRQSACNAVSEKSLNRTDLVVVDNGTDQDNRQQIVELLQKELGKSWPGNWEFISADQNLGYGRAHNHTVDCCNSKYHLVLNPDVDMAEDAISQALLFMDANQNVDLLSPYAVDERGQRQYLCKNYPAVLDLLLRGFAPGFVRSLFDRRLARYEMRGITEKEIVKGVKIASGCFMFMRCSVFKVLGGFSPRFFLFFEDFDLSLRISRLALIAYVPAVRIIHYGGHTTSRGLGRIVLFVRSAITFFNIHGWKWF